MLEVNQTYIDDYLLSVQKSSYKSANTQRGILIECLDYVNKPIHKIEKSDIRDFFINVLDKKNVVIKTKNTYRLIIKSFFNKIEQSLPKEQLNKYVNPVPKFKFSINKKKVGKATEKKIKKFKINEILEILQLSKRRSFRDFIIFGILAQTGMRIGECLTIKIEDIDFKERTIDTGLVNGAMKSFNKEKNIGIMFHFRENFKPYLQKYILWKNKENSWLFNGKSNNHLTDTQLRRIVKKYYGQKWQRFHWFRHSIITYFEKEGLSRNKVERLMNHAPSSIEDKHYTDLSIKESRAMYDSYFPYKNIPYF